MPSRPSRHPTLRSAAYAVSFTLSLHSLVAAAIAVPQVLAPVAARDLGVSASGVGVVTAAIFFAMMPMAFASGFLLGRFSERRMCQLVAAFIAAGLALAAGSGFLARSMPLPALFGAAITIGGVLFGFANGMVNAAGNQLLYNTVPERVRSLAFSIKQTAVPLGGSLAGLLIPVLLLSFSWEAVIAGMAGLAAAAVFVIAALPLADAPRARRRPLSFAELTDPLRLVWSAPRLRELCLVAVTYTAFQLAMLAYVVSYLNLELGLSLIAAGAVYSAAQVTAIIGRIAWGISVDVLGGPRRQIGLVGLAAAISSLFIAAMTPAWPLGAMIAVGALAGASGVSWNGIFIAEAARLAPSGEVAKATGGTSIFFGLGGVLGPGLFSWWIGLGGSYHAGFIALAVPLALVGAWMVAPPGKA